MAKSSERAGSKGTGSKYLTAAEDFGFALFKYREMSGLSQRALAKQGVDYSYAQLSRMEAGMATPTMESAALLDNELNAGGVLVTLAAFARGEPFAVLPPANPHFVGRTQTLDTLTTLLIDEPHTDRSTVAFVVGPPGVGKTALLRRWANTHQEEFHLVLHADLHGFGPREPTPAGTTLEVLLRGPGIGDDRIPTADNLRLALLRGHLQRLGNTGKRVLIVLDNARSSRQVSEVLPETPNVSVLVTSRARLSGLVISSGAEAISLATMDKADAVALIRSYVLGERVDAEPEAVVRLANLCGMLPLALTIAAERVASTEALTIWQHADRLADQALELQIEDDDDSSVRAAFSYSYSQLNPDQARMFRLCGLHPAEQFSDGSAGALAGVSTREASRLPRLPREARRECRSGSSAPCKCSTRQPLWPHLARLPNSQHCRPLPATSQPAPAPEPSPEDIIRRTSTGGSSCTRRTSPAAFVDNAPPWFRKPREQTPCPSRRRKTT